MLYLSAASVILLMPKHCFSGVSLLLKLKSLLSYQVENVKHKAAMLKDQIFQHNLHCIHHREHIRNTFYLPKKFSEYTNDNMHLLFIILYADSYLSWVTSFCRVSCHVKACCTECGYWESGWGCSLRHFIECLIRSIEHLICSNINELL